MARSLLLGLVATAIVFPPLAQAVAINNKTITSFKTPEINLNSPLSCTPTSNYGQCERRKPRITPSLGIDSRLWLDNVMGVLLSGSMFSKCQTNLQQNSTYEVEKSWQKRSQQNNLNCVFSWQKYTSREAKKRQHQNYSFPQIPLNYDRNLQKSKQLKAESSNKEFPKLSRSSLIVSFPQSDSTFVPEHTKFANPAPETKRIASPFGWRRRPYSYQLQFHQGIDYGAPFGSPVVSIGNGIVTKVTSGCYDFGNLFCGGQLGNWIEVDHGNGRLGIYGHLKNNSITVSEGMKVRKNQEIAKVGSSGWSTGAHLDFRFKVNGEYKDPAQYVMAIE